MYKQIVLATHNKNKLREYREILSPLHFTVIGEDDLNIEGEPEEIGTTYRENAYIKAKYLSNFVEYPVIADDSGIEIEALGDHFPGIQSNRYAKSLGENYKESNKKILEKMEGVENRNAAFHCCICLIEKGNIKPLFFEGICEGHILTEAKGENGFGYDPIFHSNEGNLDFGTASEKEKNMVSHRYKALKKLLLYLSI